MSILKALERQLTENPLVDENAASKVVPFDRAARRRTAPPEMLSSPETRIGKPVSAFIGQPDSFVGTALPDNTETGISAGAKLNAENLTCSAERSLPEFMSWEIDAERVEKSIVAIRDPHSPYAEEYRSLRTNVLHKSQRQKLQSIVVASANPGEGKTVTALNLAWLLAQTDGVKALVIDSDLRKPSLAGYIGIKTKKGLSDVLAGKATLAQTIIKLQPAGLHMLPGGEARNDVAELISGPTFKEILRQAREMFDFVIIDAPPLGIFTDATVLINHADGALLVVRANHTRYSMLERMLEPLPKDRMLGVVLNQSEDVLNETQYGNGYFNYQRLNEAASK